MTDSTKRIKWLGVRLEADIYGLLQQAAVNQERKLADFIRVILKDWLREHEYLEHLRLRVAEPPATYAKKSGRSGRLKKK